jgi:drug/metabolite transporter (DMT)-like permease
MSSYDDGGSSRRSVTASASWPAPEDDRDPLPVLQEGTRTRNGLTIILTIATGIVGIALPFVLVNRSMEVLAASTAALLLNLVPVFAVVTAVALLGEPLTLAIVVGGASILAGLTVLGHSGYAAD